MKFFTNFIKTIAISIEIGIIFMLGANIWVFGLNHGRTYTKVSKIPNRKVALVLGTSPKMKSGVANPYFIKRMEAVAALYHYGKIKKIIVSGDKSPYYDEPTAMKAYLVNTEGVPEQIIIKDNKGYSTKESVERCQKVYHYNNVIIVSQGYHIMRALFFARNLNMNALAFSAQDVTRPESYYRNHIREFLARVQAVVYYIFGKET